MTGPDAVRTQWLGTADAALRAELHRLVAAVMERGGAVGWLGVPDRVETDAWLDGITASVAAGATRMVLLRAAGGTGPVLATGRWTRYDKPTVAVNAEVLQVMVDPAARGRGLSRTLLAALVADAREHGVEQLTLDVRGNNHAAMALYEGAGFTVYGRLPDFVAVGADRWDRVLYRLDLRSGASPVRRHGSRPVGAGSSVLRPSGRPPSDAGPALAGPPGAA